MNSSYSIVFLSVPEENALSLMNEPKPSSSTSVSSFKDMFSSVGYNDSDNDGNINCLGNGGNNSQNNIDINWLGDGDNNSHNSSNNNWLGEGECFLHIG